MPYRPALIMSVIELTDEVDEGPVLFCKADTIHVVDLSPNPTGDYSLLNMLSVPGYSEFIIKTSVLTLRKLSMNRVTRPWFCT